MIPADPRRSLTLLPALTVLLLAGSVPAGQVGPALPRSQSGDHRPAPAESERARSQDGASAARPDDHYRSPYRIRFHHPEAELLFDANSPRGSVAEQSTVPIAEWTDSRSSGKLGSWGPAARKFDSPPEVRAKPAAWRRERVIAAATRFIGYDYQHHHIPDWEPAKDWPWKPVCSGRNGKGLDCSNFSAFNYNWALGIHMSSDISEQARERRLDSATGRIEAQVIARPEGDPDGWYTRLAADLKPGDLLYIRTADMSHVSHVVMWLGDCGEGPDATPLVIDAHGEGARDAAGASIPCGVRIRPFTRGGWYHRSFDHAHRLIVDAP
jgi:cell wall-associated NlpC family hydrolase